MQSAYRFFLSVELSLCAALVAILPAQMARRKELRRLGRRELGYMFLQALFGIVLFRAFTLYGLHLTSALSAGVITSAAPAIMAVLAAVALKEKLRRGQALGVGLTVAGLLLINLWGHGRAEGTGSLPGTCLSLRPPSVKRFSPFFESPPAGASARSPIRRFSFP